MDRIREGAIGPFSPKIAKLSCHGLSIMAAQGPAGISTDTSDSDISDSDPC